VGGEEGEGDCAEEEDVEEFDEPVHYVYFGESVEVGGEWIGWIAVGGEQSLVHVDNDHGGLRGAGCECSATAPEEGPREGQHCADELSEMSLTMERLNPQPCRAKAVILAL